MKPILFIQASNIHNGGGRTLLIQLLSSIPSELKTIVIVDSRMQIFQTLSSNVSIRYVKGNIIHRVFAEFWLSKNVKKDDSVLCFGNLPPLFSLKGHSTVFLQNRYLLDSIDLGNLPLRLRVRLSMERLWILLRGNHVHQFIVQTPTMFNLMKQKADGWKGVIKMLPFCDHPIDYKRSKKNGIRNTNYDVDFIYIASGELHKNHFKLIEAWCLLAKEGLFPSLWLTISEKNDPYLCSWLLERVETFKLKVINLGATPSAEIPSLYRRAGALIYPSLLESFGLPLIEAKQFELPIIASELDYVRDIVDPDETFDPQSAVSIARAVKRFMGWPENSLPLAGASEFLNAVVVKR